MSRARGAGFGLRLGASLAATVVMLGALVVPVGARHDGVGVIALGGWRLGDVAIGVVQGVIVFLVAGEERLAIRAMPLRAMVGSPFVWRGHTFPEHAIRLRLRASVRASCRMPGRTARRRTARRPVTAVGAVSLSMLLLREPCQELEISLLGGHGGFLELLMLREHVIVCRIGVGRIG